MKPMLIDFSFLFCGALFVALGFFCLAEFRTRVLDRAVRPYLVSYEAKPADGSITVGSTIIDTTRTVDIDDLRRIIRERGFPKEAADLPVVIHSAALWAFK